jgi:hypothetical protein
VWVEDGERHVRCEEFASADYYPEDWILLDEVRGRGAYKRTHLFSLTPIRPPACPHTLSLMQCI